VGGSGAGAVRVGRNAAPTGQWRRPRPILLPPFAAIRDEDFGPAFDEGLTRARAAIADIAEGPGTSFAEVIEALELAEAALDRVAGVFYNLAGAESAQRRARR
jgi:peptidyl-dipeptidase Dcp